MSSILANMGLVAWPSPQDQYNSAQQALNWQKVDNHDHSPGKGKPLSADALADGVVNSSKLGIDSVTTGKILDGAVSPPKLDSALAAKLGVTQGAVVRRGKSVIATTEVRTNAAYGALTTPDVVSGITLATDGLIVVLFAATWMNSVASAGRAAIFLGSDQLKVQSNVTTVAPSTTVPVTTAAIGNTSTDSYGALASFPGGLAGSGASTQHSANVTTGQAVGWIQSQTGVTGTQGKFELNATVTDVSVVSGACYILAAAGAYDVGVRFKSATGSVTVKNRVLRVWTIDF